MDEQDAQGSVTSKYGYLAKNTIKTSALVIHYFFILSILCIHVHFFCGHFR